MKWSEIECTNRVYGQLNENEQYTMGAFLHQIGFDLETLPDLLWEEWEFLDVSSSRDNQEEEETVPIWDIVGTTHTIYGNHPLIMAFIEAHKCYSHIIQGYVTREKYFFQLKKQIELQQPCIHLIKAKNGKYYVGKNGNHRVIFYKLMYLADLYNNSGGLGRYWLRALVSNE